MRYLVRHYDQLFFDYLQRVELLIRQAPDEVDFRERALSEHLDDLKILDASCRWQAGLTVVNRALFLSHLV